MRIAVLGATGRVGSRIIAVALQRGHEVTGIARNAEKLTQAEGFTPRAEDAQSADFWKLLRGHDVVVSAMRFNLPADTVVRAVKQAGVKRLVVVGGAGSLEVASGVQLVDTPEFPAMYKQEASAGRDFLNDLRQENELDWTFISPAAILEPGQRTGKYRIGGERLLFDGTGKSHISMEDYAIALVDEAEQGKHTRQRFQVGY